MRKLTIRRGNFNAVAYTGDGQFLVALHSGWRLRVWATSDYSERYTAQLPGILYSHGSIALLGDLAVLTHGVYDLAGVWAALHQGSGRARGHDLIREVTLVEPESRFAYVTFGTDGRAIFRTYHNHSAKGCDLTFWGAGPCLLGSLSLPYAFHYGPVVSPDGRTLAQCSGQSALLYHAVTGERLASLNHTDVVERAVFSPDGRTLATAAGRSVWLWDVASRKGERLPAFQKFVEGLAFHPGGHLLAAGDRDGEIRLIEPASGRVLASLNFEVGAIHGLAFSPDGMTVADDGHDNAVVVWDVE